MIRSAKECYGMKRMLRNHKLLEKHSHFLLGSFQFKKVSFLSLATSTLGNFSRSGGAWPLSTFKRDYYHYQLISNGCCIENHEVKKLEILNFTGTQLFILLPENKKRIISSKVYSFQHFLSVFYLLIRLDSL